MSLIHLSIRAAHTTLYGAMELCSLALFIVGVVGLAAGFGPDLQAWVEGLR